MYPNIDYLSNVDYPKMKKSDNNTSQTQKRSINIKDAKTTHYRRSGVKTGI